MKQIIEILSLTFSHNLIMGNKPDKISLPQVHKKMNTEKSSSRSFGLFDSSQPNYTTYYPDVRPEDLNPKDSDFIHPLFRALSEVIVHKKFHPIDFGKNQTLKNSMGKLRGQSVNVDHETAIGNAIGVILSEEWQEGYYTNDGLFIPRGINTLL